MFGLLVSLGLFSERLTVKDGYVEECVYYTIVQTTTGETLSYICIQVDISRFSHWRTNGDQFRPERVWNG